MIKKAKRKFLCQDLKILLWKADFNGSMRYHEKSQNCIFSNSDSNSII